MDQEVQLLAPILPQTVTQRLLTSCCRTLLFLFFFLSLSLLLLLPPDSRAIPGATRCFLTCGSCSLYVPCSASTAAAWLWPQRATAAQRLQKPSSCSWTAWRRPAGPPRRRGSQTCCPRPAGWRPGPWTSCAPGGRPQTCRDAWRRR